VLSPVRVRTPSSTAAFGLVVAVTVRVLTATRLRALTAVIAKIQVGELLVVDVLARGVEALPGDVRVGARRDRACEQEGRAFALLRGASCHAATASSRCSVSPAPAREGGYVDAAGAAV
jgi:hypothetical protein